MADTTITSSQVISDFGAYYIDEGQNEGNIHQRLRESFGTRDAFTIVDTEDTILRETNVAYTEVLQSFQTEFTPKGSVTFTPRAIPLFNVKIDQAFYPDSLKNQWLTFLTSNKLDRTTWPFVRWFIEMYVMGQISHDLELSAIYNGVYNAPTSGVANDADEVMDGVKILINNAIDGGDITPIATGTPSTTATTWCTSIEDFTKGIPELYWTTPMQLNMSRTLARRYKEGRRTKYNSMYTQVSDMMAVEDADNIGIVGRGSMTGSTKIWATPKLNAILAFKGGSNANIVEVEKVDRKVKVYTDFWIGAGFIDYGLIWTNDQELPA